jgi:hypothetical protein
VFRFLVWACIYWICTTLCVGNIWRNTRKLAFIHHNNLIHINIYLWALWPASQHGRATTRIQELKNIYCTTPRHLNRRFKIGIHTLISLNDFKCLNCSKYFNCPLATPFKVLPRHWPSKSLKKTTKDSNHDSRSPDRDSKKGPPEDQLHDLHVLYYYPFMLP